MTSPFDSVYILPVYTYKQIFDDFLNPSSLLFVDIVNIESEYQVMYISPTQSRMFLGDPV